LLENYVNVSTLSQYLSNYQPLLKAGYGISIDRSTNTISTALDLNPFIFVSSLPTTGNPNKIYIIPDITNSGFYVQYIYNASEGRWIELGHVSIGTIISGYLT